jgi:hypothetical protein
MPATETFVQFGLRHNKETAFVTLPSQTHRHEYVRGSEGPTILIVASDRRELSASPSGRFTPVPIE